jgi:serine/threonine protein kinase
MANQGPLTDRVLGGKYLLGNVLGKGGFGVVYAGYHQVLNRQLRQLAIKVLHEHYFIDPKFRERFLREALTVAALDHLHILHIYDFGMEEQESRAYLVMPFIRRGTFRDLLKQQGSLNLEQTATYLEQISKALDYAHQCGVVHLDLKPHMLLSVPGMIYGEINMLGHCCNVQSKLGLN